MNEVVLSIDCGTQSLRILLFDTNGTLLDSVQIPYEPYVSPKPSWAEQDPEVFWMSLCKACCTLKEKSPDLFGRIAGVGVTTQRDSMICVDRDGNSLRPVIIWLDQRKARRVYKPGGPVNFAFKLVGMDEALSKTQTDAACNWIMQYQPDIWQKTYKYLQVSGFLNHRLTGEFLDSVASQIGHIPFDYKKLKWSKMGELTTKLFPIEPDKLPDLVNPGDLIGRITTKAAKQTGIQVGTPVIACGSDKGCETIGVGVVNNKMASLSFGTTATVQTTTAKYFEPIRFMPPYPAPIPGHYNPEVEIFRGFWMITWFKNEFAYKEVLEAEKQGIAPEKVMNDLLAQSPPGSMGLVVQPYWGPGLKHPSAKGAIIGFGDVHRKSHMYRAVIEGLAYALLDGLHTMQKRGRFFVEKLAVSGGASQSDEICQISADVFNLPLVRGSTYESCGLGAAIVTTVGLRLHSSFESAIRTMVRYERVFEPDQKNVSIYQQLYSRVYRKMYRSLELLYQEIRDITGYPEKAE